MKMVRFLISKQAKMVTSRDEAKRRLRIFMPYETAFCKHTVVSKSSHSTQTQRSFIVFGLLRRAVGLPENALKAFHRRRQ